jgi:enoyl-CoA hydratase/carnithine racemase
MTAQPVPGDVLARSHDGGVTTLTLNCPERRNSLSEAMLGALSSALAAIAADRSTRVVVIASTGTVFSAGHDLKELTAHRGDPDRGRAYFQSIMTRCAEVMQAIVRLPQPVIAQVQGMATAAGCQLVASCDLAVASREARFATPGVQIGLFCSTPMVALSRNIAAKHAMAMLLTGEALPAEEAARIGLVNHVVEAEELEAQTLLLARRIAERSSLTLRTGKEAFYRQREMPLGEAYDYAAKVMVENMLARDAEEGIGAFLEKRQPRWEDR